MNISGLTSHYTHADLKSQGQFHDSFSNFISFRLLFESEIALFLNEVWGQSAFDEELARNPYYRPLTLGGEVMAPQDNSTLAFITTT